MFMKKLYVFMTALLALFAINANADRILYSENYEAGGVPATWTINGNASKTYATIVGDQEGKYLSFYNSDNGRSAHCLWGESIFDAVKEGLAEYTVSVDFSFQAFGNNQFNGEFAIFSGENCPKTNGAGSGSNWSDFPTVTPNCLFAITQQSNTDAAKGDTDHTHWYINGEQDNFITPEASKWYTLVLTVNTATREVGYSLDDFDGTFHKAGSKVLAEDANVYASGLYVMNARYNSTTNVDNIMVSVPGDFANVPVIALTGLNKAERTYTISFMKGETLHVTNTDGNQKTAAYDDCEGKYVISTTKSGTISAYTTAGTKTSETATMDVVCEPIVLPVPTYAIVAADEGYAKTYSFSVDNSTVEMQPVIYIDIKFEGEDGTILESKNNVKVATFSVPTKGKLTVTTKDLNGYYDNGSATILNDIEYTIKHDIDFQHMTGEQLIAKEFEKMGDLNSTTMSGENNWTGRMHMWFSIATGEKDTDGNDITNNYPAFGWVEGANDYEKVLEGATQADGTFKVNGYTFASLETAEPVTRYRYLQSKLTKETAHSLFAPLYVWYGITGIDKTSGWNIDGDNYTPKTDEAGHLAGTTNVKLYPGIGLVHSGILGDDELYDPANKGYGNIIITNVSMGVDGLTENDLIVVSKIDNYGGGSVRPVFDAGTSIADAKAQYKAMHLGAINSTCKGNETFQLANTNTALNRVLVLSPKNASGIDELNYNKIVSDHNAPIYNLNGVKMNPNALTKGIYVKQGKKFVVK